jgi:hypothetical protein
VETALHSFFVSVPQAAALWMLMLLGIAFGVAVMALPRKAPAPPVSQADLDDRRYAEEVVVAAGRAAATAARRRDEWAAAQQRLEVAWIGYDRADRAARQAAAAAAYPLLSRRRKPGDNVDRERWLHHAATAACRQRDISIAQLNDVYAHRGWNPRLHPVVQETALRQAIREHHLECYDRAQEQERAAWRAAETAAESLRSLRAEALTAITRTGLVQPAGDVAWWAEQWTTAELPAAA